MDKKFERYNKYCVFKYSDAVKYLTTSERAKLRDMLTTIDRGRLSDKKKIHDYIVVNQSMPCAEKVWGLIQQYWEDVK